MQLFHLSVKPVKRSEGRSIVAAAAYRAADRLNDRKYGIVHDYSRKTGVVYSEVVLPNHAPLAFYNRENLWNAVEEVEKSTVSRLGREIEISFPYEFDQEESIRIIREYVQSNFVDQGMCADISIHNPQKKTANPHAHVLLTTRAIDQNGQWMAKKRKDYILDSNGQKQYDRTKKTYKFRTVSTTDWDNREKVEMWRKNWYKSCLREFRRKGIIPDQFDYRSHKRRGILTTASPNMPMAAWQMEEKGILTKAGDRKRDVVTTNQLTIQRWKEMEDRVARIESDIQKDQTPQTERIEGPITLYQSINTEDFDVTTAYANYLDLAVKINQTQQSATELQDQLRRFLSQIERLNEREENIVQLEAALSKQYDDMKKRQLTERKLQTAIESLKRDVGISPEQIDEKIKQVKAQADDIQTGFRTLADVESLKLQQQIIEQQLQDHFQKLPHERKKLEERVIEVGKREGPYEAITDQIVAQSAEKKLRQQLTLDTERKREQKREHSRGI